jgi:hypothetical protein
MEEYESVLSTHFPNDFRSFLLEMNGADLLTINVNAPTGSQRESVGVYSYLRDIEIVPIAEMWAEMQTQVEELTGQAGLQILRAILEKTK